MYTLCYIPRHRAALLHTPNLDDECMWSATYVTQSSMSSASSLLQSFVSCKANLPGTNSFAFGLKGEAFPKCPLCCTSLRPDWLAIGCFGCLLLLWFIQEVKLANFGNLLHPSQRCKISAEQLIRCVDEAIKDLMPGLSSATSPNGTLMSKH